MAIITRCAELFFVVQMQTAKDGRTRAMDKADELERCLALAADAPKWDAPRPEELARVAERVGDQATDFGTCVGCRWWSEVITKFAGRGLHARCLNPAKQMEPNAHALVSLGCHRKQPGQAVDDPRRIGPLGGGK